MTQLFTYDEASEKWGIPRDWLVEAVNSGELKAIKRGKGYIRLREVTLDRWLEAKEQTV